MPDALRRLGFLADLNAVLFSIAPEPGTTVGFLSRCQCLCIERVFRPMKELIPCLKQRSLRDIGGSKLSDNVALFYSILLEGLAYYACFRNPHHVGVEGCCRGTKSSLRTPVPTRFLLPRRQRNEHCDTAVGFLRPGGMFGLFPTWAVPRRKTLWRSCFATHRKVGVPR